MAEWMKYNHLSLALLNMLPTLHQGHTDDTKIIDHEAGCEVLLSRLNEEGDGEEYNHKVTILGQNKESGQYTVTLATYQAYVQEEFYPDDVESIVDFSLAVGALAAKPGVMPEGYDFRDLSEEIMLWNAEFSALMEIHHRPQGGYLEKWLSQHDRYKAIMKADHMGSVDAFIEYRLDQWAEARRPQ